MHAELTDKGRRLLGTDRQALPFSIDDSPVCRYTALCNLIKTSKKTPGFIGYLTSYAHLMGAIQSTLNTL
jgi:hypothetical protein